MEMLDKKDISRAVMAKFCAKCSLEDNCDKTCNIYTVLNLIDKHAFFFTSCCGECNFSEEFDILPRGRCYCNYWRMVVEKDDSCSNWRKKSVRH